MEYEVVEACRIPGHGWVQPGKKLDLTPSQARYPEIQGQIRVPVPPQRKRQPKGKGAAGS